MPSTHIPSQSFGKATSEHRSGYQILLSAPELQPLTAHIESVLRFQWLSQPEREAERYPAVWYFHPIDAQRGLLYYFEDKGSDPRPHVLHRVVGLCQRDEHESLLAALASGLIPNQTLNSEGQWELRFDAPRSADHFEWKSQFLHRGDPDTYDLSIRHGTTPAPAKKAQVTPWLSPPRSRMKKSLYTHLSCLITGIVITLLLYPRAEPTTEATSAAKAPVTSVQGDRELQETTATYIRMREEAQHLQASLTAMQQLSEVYRQSMQRFKNEHADKLTAEQIHELTQLINSLHP